VVYTKKTITHHTKYIKNILFFFMKIRINFGGLKKNKYKFKKLKTQKIKIKIKIGSGHCPLVCA
jgi:hypothetical protein